MFGPTVSFAWPHAKWMGLPGYESGIDLFWLIAGPQSEDSSVALRHRFLSAMPLLLRGLEPVALCGAPKLGLVFAGFGWLRMVRAGKFCHARRVVFCGHELM